MTFIVKHNINQAALELKATRKSQIPFATRLTINQLARNAKKETVDQIKSRIDRPTRYSLRSMRTKNATKATMTARVFVNDKRKENVLLEHLFTGGARTSKNAEVLLRRIGVLPTGMFIVPGEFAPIDSFGNIRRAFINKIIRYFKASKPQGQNESSLHPGVWVRRFDRKQKKTRKQEGKTGTFEFFVVHKKINSKRGSRTSGKRLPPEPVLLFVKRPTYKRIFDMPKTVKHVINRDLKIEFAKAYARAVETAR